MPLPRRTPLLASTAFLAAWGSTASAQTGPALLLDPFRPDDQFELDVEWLVGLPTRSNSRVGGRAFDLRSDSLRLASRVRLTPGESDVGLARAQPRAGFALASLRFDGDDPGIPAHIGDASVGLGMGILAVDGWLGGFTIGGGYASAGGGDGTDGVSFLARDANAPYVQANFAVGKTFESGDAFGVVLSFDGNRTIFPDIPLPGFQYRRAFSDDLSVAVGFPFSTVEWRPVERLDLRLQFTVPDSISLDAAYDVARPFGRPLALFGSLSSRVTAAHWDELASGHRVFFRQRLAEAGLTLRPGPDENELRFTIAGGIAFDQQFEGGWDTRNARRLADVDDNGFVRVAIELKL